MFRKRSAIQPLWLEPERQPCPIDVDLAKRWPCIEPIGRETGQEMQVEVRHGLLRVSAACVQMFTPVAPRLSR
jgi:hypothetical protein